MMTEKLMSSSLSSDCDHDCNLDLDLEGGTNSNGTCACVGNTGSGEGGTCTCTCGTCTCGTRGIHDGTCTCGTCTCIVNINSMADEQWLAVFPPGVTLLHRIFTSHQNSRILKYFYIMFSGLLAIIGVLLPLIVELNVLVVEEDDHYESASYAFLTFFYIQFIIYLYLPFYYSPLLYDMFVSKDIRVLFEEAIWLTSLKTLQFRFKVTYFTSMGVNTLSMMLYMYFHNSDVVDYVFTIVWFVFYIFPISIVFGFLICVLEAHRVQAACFRENLVYMRQDYEAARTSSFSVQAPQANESPKSPSRSTSMTVFRSSNVSGGAGMTNDIGTNNASNSSNVLRERQSSMSGNRSLREEFSVYRNRVLKSMRQYYHLHDAFRNTSNKMGGYYFSSFLLPVMIILSSIWSIYENFFTLKATIAYVAMAIFYLLQLGIMLANVNETGNLVCREVSSILMRVLVDNCILCEGEEEKDAYPPSFTNKVNGFVSCLTHIKIEIPFFGNFTLRSRTLLAIVASLLGAIISGIIRNAI
jgi:hypothetical protein